MNHKIKFGELPVGEPFLYNDIFYIKTSESQGSSQRLGPFNIHPSELVEVAHIKEKSSRIWQIPVIRFVLMWLVVMGAIYAFGELCL